VAGSTSFVFGLFIFYFLISNRDVYKKCKVTPSTHGVYKRKHLARRRKKKRNLEN
jgi:hypothetical protein